MSKRNLRARRNAKQLKPVVKKEVKKEYTPIAKLDAESMEVIESFESVDQAIEKLGLNQPNLVRALKNKTKYKGFYWDFD